MNKKIRKAWTNALESGQYQQGRGYLRKNSHGKIKYCCLGVLREVVRNRFTNIKLQKSTDEEILNVDQAFAIGISSRMQDRLALMNDGSPEHPRYSFKEIAKFIRKEL